MRAMNFHERLNQRCGRLNAQVLQRPIKNHIRALPAKIQIVCGRCIPLKNI
jgi:hypothetical protein